jgi:DNA-binding NtrC family response regulator
MKRKNIVLFEHDKGVRFVLGKSLSMLGDEINVQASDGVEEIKQYLKNDSVDLLITELCKNNPCGLKLSIFARQIHPDMKIIWVTVMGCHHFSDVRKELGNITCVEKPLEIQDFRYDVLNALSLAG